MARWLAWMVMGALGATMPAHAQIQSMAAAEVANVARQRSIDLRLTETIGPQRHHPLIRGLIVRHDFAPNAAVGLGMANIYRKKSGSEPRLGERPARSRKPAVTFVFRF